MAWIGRLQGIRNWLITWETGWNDFYENWCCQCCQPMRSMLSTCAVNTVNLCGQLLRLVACLNCQAVGINFSLFGTCLDALSTSMIDSSQFLRLTARTFHQPETLIAQVHRTFEIRIETCKRCYYKQHLVKIRIRDIFCSYNCT